MGFWPHWEYEDFVKAHADSRQRIELLHPPGDPFDPDYPGILVGYDSMPDWMDFSDLITLDYSDKHLTRANEVHFRVLLQAYRTDRANYIRDVKSRLRQVKGRRTGMALLAEIDATKNAVKVVPYHGSDINAEAGSWNRRDVVDAIARDRRVNYGNYKDQRKPISPQRAACGHATREPN
jgi:hypothetical protein